VSAPAADGRPRGAARRGAGAATHHRVDHLLDPLVEVADDVLCRVGEPAHRQLVQQVAQVLARHDGRAGHARRGPPQRQRVVAFHQEGQHVAVQRSAGGQDAGEAGRQVLPPDEVAEAPQLRRQLAARDALLDCAAHRGLELLVTILLQRQR
jgi:hypothetical protein